MTKLRAFWMALYPFLLASNKAFGTSYKWVNIGYGAWKRDGFTPLWQYRWYGEPITSMPNTAIINGINFRIVVSDGLVQFYNKDITTERICFERDPYEKHAFIWYVECFGRVAACHVRDSYELITAVYGGSHDIKKIPVQKKPYTP